MSDNKDDPIITPDDPIIPAPSTASNEPVLPDTKSTAVSVDPESTHTPISREEIPQVDALGWNDMTISELYDQLLVMERRKHYCQVHSPMIVKDIERGIKQLQAIINKKHGGEIKLI